MRLSEAIALGYAEIEHTNNLWLVQKPDGTCRGCAIGAALFAIGRRNALTSEEIFIDRIVAQYWPWTKQYCGDVGFTAEISWKYKQVLEGKSTIDQLIDWVRSVEPAEETPSSIEPCAPSRDAELPELAKEAGE